MTPSVLATLLEPHLAELVAFRRDLHAHPELAFAETRTTARVAARLAEAGLAPQLLPGSGLVCDVGNGSARTVALRADLDALPVQDEKVVPYRSQVDGVAHACGHDVHTTAVLGAGLLLAELAAQNALPGRVRLIFQPAEESQPGGALDVLAAGALDGASHIFALHCDPRLDVGHVGVRAGPITSACDQVEVRLVGHGGHTSRPHLTEDLVFALGQVITQVPAVLSRRLDPRAGTCLVWGSVNAGRAANAIPSSGTVTGTLRLLDVRAWEEAGTLLTDAVREVTAPFGVRAEVVHIRGVPPVVNDLAAASMVESAGRSELGAGAMEPTEQSLGGEDFAWYLDKIPGAMARLGTRPPDGGPADLHQGDFDVDEGAIGIGARLLAATAVQALEAEHASA